MYVPRVALLLVFGCYCFCCCILCAPMTSALQQHGSRTSARSSNGYGNGIFALVSSSPVPSSSLSFASQNNAFTNAPSSSPSNRQQQQQQHCRALFSRSNNNGATENSDDDGAAPSGPVIIDGKKTAAAIRSELAEEIKILEADHDTTPGLAVVLVGERVDSATYVRMKKKAAAEIGIHSVDVTVDEAVSEEALIAEIRRLNEDQAVHGILVQLPLPSHIDEARVLKTIRYEKDADGFDATNIGNMWLRGGEPPLALPCTPAGCIELLQRYRIDISGKECVVLGRSNIVGMPVAALLTSCNGTVTVCHSRTKNIEEHVRRADIVVAAIGKTEFVRGEWLKEGVVVIDVGINDKPDATKKRGYRLVGDVNYGEALKKASAITPVPGGVGPMTIAMLMKNTVNLCRHSLGLPRLQLRDRSRDGDYENRKLVNVNVHETAAAAPAEATKEGEEKTTGQ
mmetsp:Transcript_22287/g.46960  ORF Transcript_22287/g.46960 Transcript_22287/m.46960 type:complete len:455 (+) Transcript_22287:177-1541(+)